MNALGSAALKVSRNSFCSCGSGKKYKRCCIHSGAVDLTVKNKTQNVNKSLVKTLTNELTQPVRLYYKVTDFKSLAGCFDKLKCVSSHLETEHWILNYEEEAANLGLYVPKHKLPIMAQPLLLAKIHIEENVMLIDLRSFERACKIIEFLDQHIPRVVAEITHASIYNKLISSIEVNDVRDVDFDSLFAPERVTEVNPKEIIAEIENIKARYVDRADAIKQFAKFTAAKAREHLPEVEKFPVHYYTDGIKQFESSCRLRQMIAEQHFLGRKDYTLDDLTQDIVLNYRRCRSVDDEKV